MQADSSAGGVLRQLADCDSTGVLQVDGPPRGTFRLVAGGVVAVVTDAVPDLVTRLGQLPDRLTAEERRAVARSVLIDASVALLARPSPVPPRFQAGDGARDETWDSADLEVDDLLAEVADRVGRLAGVALEPDDVMIVRPLPDGGRVRLDPITWQLLHGLDRPRSPRVLAWQLGLPLVDTVLAAAAIVDQGGAEIVRIAPRAGGPEPIGAGGPEPIGSGMFANGADGVNGVNGASGVAGANGTGGPQGARPLQPSRVAAAGGTAAPALPRRRAAVRKTSSAWAVALSGPAAQPPDRDLLVRVLEGLRRL